MSTQVVVLSIVDGCGTKGIHSHRAQLVETDRHTFHVRAKWASCSLAGVAAPTGRS